MLSRYAPLPPTRQTCVITHLPARYRDPLTGLPYHNAAAFHQIGTMEPVPGGLNPRLAPLVLDGGQIEGA